MLLSALKKVQNIAKAVMAMAQSFRATQEDHRKCFNARHRDGKNLPKTCIWSFKEQKVIELQKYAF